MVWTGPSGRRLSSTARIARASIQRRICGGSVVCCRSMAMPGSPAWSRADAGDTPQLAFCWAHVRRKFYDIHVATPSRRSPKRHCGASQHSMRSKLTSAQRPPRTAARAPAAQPPAGRGDACMADPATRPHLRPIRVGAGDPLRPEPLGRVDPVPRRWSSGPGHQHRGTGDPPSRAGSQECFVRRHRQWWPALGDHRLADPDGEAE